MNTSNVDDMLHWIQESRAQDKFNAVTFAEILSICGSSEILTELERHDIENDQTNHNLLNLPPVTEIGTGNHPH